MFIKNLSFYQWSLNCHTNTYSPGALPTASRLDSKGSISKNYFPILSRMILACHIWTKPSTSSYSFSSAKLYIANGYSLEPGSHWFKNIPVRCSLLESQRSFMCRIHRILSLRVPIVKVTKYTGLYQPWGETTMAEFWLYLSHGSGYPKAEHALLQYLKA